MLTLRRENGSVLRIANSESEMTNTLFHPIDGKHTADGFLLPARKREQKFMVGKKLYCVNIHGIIIAGYPQDDGKTFWQCQIDFENKSERAFIDAVSKGRDRLGHYFK